jgi:hypothetical protein
MLGLVRLPLAFNNPGDDQEVRLDDLGSELLDEALRERQVDRLHVGGKLRRVSITLEETIERVERPLLALAPRVLLAVVEVFGEELDGDGALNDGEEQSSPGDNRVVSLVSGGEGVRNAVLVRFDDEGDEGSLESERRGVGWRGGKDALGKDEELGEKMDDQVGKDGSFMVLGAVPGNE